MDNSSLLEQDRISEIFSADSNVFLDTTRFQDIFGSFQPTQSGNGSGFPIVRGDLEGIETSEIEVNENVFGLRVYDFVGSSTSNDLSSTISSFTDYQTDTLSGGASSVNSESANWESSTVAEDSLLEEAITIAVGDLTQFKDNPDYVEELKIPFGDDILADEAADAIDSLINGDANINLEIVKIDNLNTDAAFAPETGTIYISEDFLEESQDNPENVSAVILEEWGHYLDSILNDTDSAGDEGEIFTSLVKGYNFDLDVLQAEDDTTVLTIDGEDVVVEQAFGTLSIPTRWIAYQHSSGAVIGFKRDGTVSALTDIWYNGVTYENNQAPIRLFNGSFSIFTRVNNTRTQIGLDGQIRFGSGRILPYLTVNSGQWTRVL